MTCDVVILAAGQGTRMHSSRPKVLHRLGHKPLLAHVIDAAAAFSPQKIHIVVGHQADKVQRALLSYADVSWVDQIEQLGTGHAVQQALPKIDANSRVLILYGDVPLVCQQDISALLNSAADLTLLSVVLPDPTGMGRVIRAADGQVQRIVEHKDATDAERAIHETFTGMLCVKAALLHQWLPSLGNDNAQGEYYLTDIIRLAVAQSVSVEVVIATDPHNVQGVNDRAQLAVLERVYQQRQAQQLLMAGVSLRDPARVDIRGTIEVGEDTEIDVNFIAEGQVKIGRHCQIGANVTLKNVTLADHVTIYANSIVEGATVGEWVKVGPFARIRPKTVLHAHSEVGNFVEVNRSQLGTSSKVKHLSYLGDTVVGKDSNIGAGTIVCNYDGAFKHQTLIADNVFIGSGVELVSPVNIGTGATIAAGSTVTEDVPDEQLCIARARQTIKGKWTRPSKVSIKTPTDSS